MRFLKLNLAIAAWLLISAFMLGHTPLSMGVTLVSGAAIGVLALASAGRPALRYAITCVAVVMGFAALLLPDLSAMARLDLALVAPVVFALSLVSPTHTPHEVASAD